MGQENRIVAAFRSGPGVKTAPTVVLNSSSDALLLLPLNCCLHGLVHLFSEKLQVTSSN